MMKTSSDAASKYVATDLACESGRVTPDKYKSAKYERHEEGDVTVEILSVEDEREEFARGRVVESARRVEVIDLVCEIYVNDRSFVVALESRTRRESAGEHNEADHKGRDFFHDRGRPP